MFSWGNDFPQTNIIFVNVTRMARQHMYPDDGFAATTPVQGKDAIELLLHSILTNLFNFIVFIMEIDALLFHHTHTYVRSL